MFSTTEFHPMVVHFPIAIVIIGFLADILYLIFKKEKWLGKAGFYLLILGTLSAAVAYLTGLIFTDELTGEAGRVLDRHHFFAMVTLWTLVACSAFRIFIVIKKLDEGPLKWMVFLLYTIALISVSFAGYYGGTIVYEYMMTI